MSTVYFEEFVDHTDTGCYIFIGFDSHFLRFQLMIDS